MSVEISFKFTQLQVKTSSTFVLKGYCTTLTPHNSGKCRFLWSELLTFFMNDDPVFWLLGHLLSVKSQKSLGAKFFGCAVLNPMGTLFWASNWFRLCENHCNFCKINHNCASRWKFCRNEFFKHASKISKSRLHRHFWFVQVTIKRSPCFDYSVNFGRKICVLTPHNWPRNVHLRASKTRLCCLTFEILYACLKNSKWAICNVHLKVTSWFKTDGTCEALLKILSNLSKFLCAQLHFVTAQLAILHNYNNLHAQAELVTGSKIENFPLKIPNHATRKCCAQGFSAFDTE
jgi:hypothetical protein